MSYFKAFNSDNSKPVRSSETIYSNVQRLFFKCKGKEDRQRNVRVELDLVTGISPVSKKSLSLKLTDDDDPYFFFSLLVTEDDFKSLKTHQGLLIDFINFPAQLVLLLQQCKTEGEISNPKFLLLLDEDSTDSMLDGVHTFLKFVEKNQFKQLNHLSLHIGSGSDDEIKQYMAFKIKHLKEVVAKRDTKLSQMESNLENALSKLKATCNNLDEMQKKWFEEKNQIQIQHLKDLASEHEQFSNAQLQWQKEKECRKKEENDNHLRMIRGLESQIAELKCTNQSNYEKLREANARNRELMNEFTELQKKQVLLKQDMLALRNQNAKLDSDYHEKDKGINHLHTEKAILEQELHEKTILLGKLQDQVSLLNEHKAQLKERLDEKDSVLLKKNANIAAVTKDLLKANEILARLQSQQADISSKLKLRTSITLEQEKLLEKQQRELRNLQAELIKCEEKLQSLQESEKQLEEQLSAANVKLEERERTLKNNDNVITWLNRRLTELQSRPLHDSMLPGTTSTPYQELTQTRMSNSRQLRQFQYPCREASSQRSTALSLPADQQSSEDIKSKHMQITTRGAPFKDSQVINTNLAKKTPDQLKSKATPSAYFSKVEK